MFASRRLLKWQLLNRVICVLSVRGRAFVRGDIVRGRTGGFYPGVAFCEGRMSGHLAAQPTFACCGHIHGVVLSKPVLQCFGATGDINLAITMTIGFYNRYAAMKSPLFHAQLHLKPRWWYSLKMSVSIRWEKTKSSPLVLIVRQRSLSRFDTTHECDRRTDGRTDTSQQQIPRYTVLRLCRAVENENASDG